MSKIRIGFVGVGGMGQAAHLRNYATNGACEVVAVAELRPKLRAAVMQRYNIPTGYADHTEMLAKEKLDGIVASQQFTLHGQLIPDLLSYGVPVLTEKPIGRSREVAEKLVKASKASTGKLYVGYHKRSDPATLYARQVIAELRKSGELGRFKYLRLSMPPGDWVAEGFSFNLNSDEGYPSVAWDPTPAGMDEKTAKDHESFVNFYIHHVNLMRYLFNEDYEVRYADPAGIVMAVTSASGVPGILEMAPYQTTTDWNETAQAYFERGYVAIELPAPLAHNRAGKVTVFKDPGQGVPATTTVPTMPWRHAMRSQADSFVRLCKGEATHLCTAEDALSDILVADRYIESLKQMRAAASQSSKAKA